MNHKYTKELKYLVILLTYLVATFIYGCSDSPNQKDVILSTSRVKTSIPPSWEREVQYQKLIKIPEVRDMVSRHAAMAKKIVSSEEYLAMLDKAIPGSSAVISIAAQTGFETGKVRSENFSIPPGVVLVSTLCSLARHGQVLRQVQQYENGCLLIASLPSDFFSFEGTLYIKVIKVGNTTRVDGSTLIKGQLFDWGKSKRCLEELFTDLKTTPV